MWPMTTTQDHPFRGILLMLGFCVLAPLGDSVAKLLGGLVPLIALIFVRFSVQGLVLLPLALRNGWPKGLTRDIWIKLTLRTLLHILGIGLMFSALRFLPLADAIAIAFVMPFIMLILGHFVLGEAVGPHRIIACAVGFIGTLLVIQPNFVAIGWPALLPLGVAVVFALFMLVTRQIAKSLDPITLQTISGFQASLLLLPFLIFLPKGIGLMDTPPTPLIWGGLLALGLIGTLAHLMMTWSLRFAPAATLAPMQYLEIPIGTVIGWMIFRDLPNGLAAVGIVITVGAGLYIIIRERQLSRHPTQIEAASSKAGCQL